MRFLIDAQLPPGLAGRLREAGHDAHHVTELLSGDASDHQVLAKAHELKAVLATKDEDFAEFARRGLVDAGIVWIRFGNVTNRVLWARISPLLPEMITALADGEVLVEIV